MPLSAARAVFLKIAPPTSIISNPTPPPPPPSARTHGWQNATTHLPSSQIWSHVAESWLKRRWLTHAATCSRCIQAQQKLRRRDVSSLSPPSGERPGLSCEGGLKALRAQSSLSSSYAQKNIACRKYNGGFTGRLSPRWPAVVHVSHKASAPGV